MNLKKLNELREIARDLPNISSMPKTRIILGSATDKPGFNHRKHYVVNDGDNQDFTHHLKKLKEAYRKGKDDAVNEYVLWVKGKNIENMQDNAFKK